MDNMSNYLPNLINSSDLYTEPSFFKGVARVLDLFGQLDEYNYKDDPDTEALKRDWTMIGKDLFISIKNYGRSKTSRK